MAAVVWRLHGPGGEGIRGREQWLVRGAVSVRVPQTEEHILAWHLDVHYVCTGCRRVHV